MPGISFRSSLSRVLRSTARAAVCIAVLGIASTLLFLRAARAQISESLSGFGAELMTWQSVRTHTAPRTLSLNGLELGLVSASTDESVRQALDRFHALCRKRGGLSVPGALRDRFPAGLDGALREETASEGFLACLDTGGPLALDELGERLGEFARSGDLKALGELRYVFARRRGEKTSLLVLWTEGSASLLHMFPEQGDAPGRDPNDVPRPAKTKRLLSAAEHGAPYSLSLYDAPGRSTDELGRWYRTALEAKGWAVSPGGSPGTLVARRASRTLIVRVATARRSGQVVASVLELS